MRDLEGQRQAGGPLRVQELREVHALDELHDDVGGAVVVEGEVVERAMLGCLQPRSPSWPRRGTRRSLGVGDDVRLHHLDDADLVEEPVADLVDGAHAALADLLEDLVLAFETCR